MLRFSNELPSMQTRFDLTQADIPKQRGNLLPDFPEPLPPLHPGPKDVQATRRRWR